MAVTGTGTQADPFIVHSYSEFMSLSAHGPITGTEAVYIKWFDTPGQVLDCNDYGSEFIWDEFTTETPSSSGSNTFYIDLNGVTIKNFLIAPGKTMFNPKGYSGGYTCKMEVYNGAIRNVFIGSATSKICGDYVEFHDVSISANVAGSTVIPFAGNGNLVIDNCAIYLQASTLNTSLFNRTIITDTDIELHIGDQNGKAIFNGNNDNPRNMQIHDCRLQGKISGNGYTSNYYGNKNMALGALNASNAFAEGVVDFVNCVIDMDFTESNANIIIYTNDNGVSVNTNIICNSHYPEGVTPPSNWNYISHTLMRNGAYLNAQGFTVVQVVEG